MGDDERESSNAARPVSLPTKSQITDAVDATRTVEDEARPAAIKTPAYLDGSPARAEPGFTSIPNDDPTELEDVAVHRNPRPPRRFPVAAIVALVVILAALVVAALVRTGAP